MRLATIPKPNPVPESVVDDPRTVEEWQAFLAKWPSPLIQCKLKGGWGTGQVPGQTLLSVSKYGMALIVPPNHKKTELVHIDSIKLWRKAHANRLEVERKREGKSSGRGWAIPLLHLPHVIVDLLTNRMIQPATRNNLSMGWTANPDAAAVYKNRMSAHSAIGIWRRKLGDSVDLQIMTIDEARTRFAPKPAPERIPEPAPVAAIEIEEPKAPEPQPAPQPEAKTVVVGQIVAQAEPDEITRTHNAWVAAMREVAAAELILADARGKAQVARVEMEIAACRCGARI